MHSQSSAPSVCLIRLSAIGDTCHALAVARRIQDQWPDSRVTWIIGKTEASLLGDIAGIEFIIFDKSDGVAAYWRLYRQLSGRRFDYLLCMHASMRANWLTPLVSADRKIGFDRQRAKDGQHLFTDETIEPREKLHVLDGMMQFADHIGVPVSDLRWDIPLGERDIAFAKHYTGAGPVLLISPCSSMRLRNFRNWQVERYVAVARHARDRFGATVIVTGGGSDTEATYGEALAEQAAASNLVGRTTLKQLYALLRFADVILCPDSGPAHMGTAAGTPVVGLYATSDPRRTGPYLSSDCLVNAYPKAVRTILGRDMNDLRFGTRVRDPGAMELIEVRNVIEKIDFALKTGK